MTVHDPVLENSDFVGAEGNRLAATVYLRFDPGLGNGGKERPKPPVLLMHGGGQTRHSWDGAARQIAGMGYTAITVDARGHGDSEWVASGNYSFDFYAHDLRCLATQIGEKWGSAASPPVVVGASMGGISAMLAQADPYADVANDIFSAIVLVDITPRMESTGVDRIMGFMSQNMRDGFASVEEAADTVGAYLPNRKRPKSLNGLQKNLRQRDDGRWYWHWDPAFIESQNNILVGREDRRHVLLEAAQKISVPTLLVRGGKSELVTQAAADEFLQLVPHAKYVDVSDAGHMVAGDKNDIFASAVIDFLNAESSG